MTTTQKANISELFSKKIHNAVSINNEKKKHNVINSR